MLFVTFDILVFTSLIWFMVQFLRFVFPPLFETIQGDYGVSNTEVGFMFSALLFAYSCMQFPAGYLSDVFNERVVITAGTVVFGLGSLLVVLSDPFWTLLVGVGLIGLGTGTHKTVAVNLLSRLYPSKTGLSIGVMDTIGQAGGVFAPAVVVLVFVIAIDWRSIFLVGAGVCVALAYGFHRSILRTVSEADTAERMGEEGSADEDERAKSYIDIFRHYHFAAFVAVSSIYTFSWVGVTSFYPLYLSNVASFSAGTAGLLYSLLFALSVCQPLTGWLSDRFSTPNIVLITFGLILGGLLAVLFSQGRFAYITTTLVLGLGFHGFRPVREAYFMEIIPDAVGGGVLGLVRTVMTMLGAVAPTLLGILADVFGLTYSFAVLTGVILVGIGLTASMKVIPMPSEEPIAA